MTVRPGVTFVLVTPASLAQVTRFRRWSVERGRAAGATADALRSIELMVSEVVTNVVVHAPRTRDLTLRSRIDGTLALFEVDDVEPAPPLVRAAGSLLPGGLGMQIVAELSTAWGWRPVPTGGKTVWFTAALRGTVDPAP